MILGYSIGQNFLWAVASSNGRQRTVLNLLEEGMKIKSVALIWLLLAQSIRLMAGYTATRSDLPLRPQVCQPAR
jgi:hypothetical protein